MSLLHKNLVGVDIGAYSIKVVSLRGGRGAWKVEAAAIRRFEREEPGMAALTGSPGDGDETPGLLKEMFSANRIRNRMVATALSGDRFVFRQMELPNMPAKDLAEAVRWEFRKEATIPVDDMVCDYVFHGAVPTSNAPAASASAQSPGEGGERLSLLGFAAKKSEVEALIDSFSSASLDLRVVDVVPTALMAAFDAACDWEPNVNNALIDIGESRSTLAILKDRKVEFTRDLHFGGSDVTRAISAALHSSEEEAEAMKLTLSLARDEAWSAGKTTEELERAGQARKSVLSVIEGLCSEIHRSIDYYQAQFRAGPVSKLYISGATALMKGLDEFISDTLGLLCFTFDPFKRFKVPGSFEPGVLASMAPALTIAVGLATRSAP